MPAMIFKDDMTRIRITIDELVLDGARHLDKEQLTAALQQALLKQWAAQGLPSAVTIPQVQRDVNGLSTETVAQQIAQSIYSNRK
jgi:hypothetical protein